MKHFTVTTFILIAFVFPISTSAQASSITDHLRKTTLTVQVLPVQLDAIPRGATRITLLPLAITASCMGDVRLNSIRVKRYGHGDSADIKGVYVISNGRRINRSIYFSSDDQIAELRLRGLRVPACKTIRLNIAVDFKRGATVGGRFALMVNSASDINTNADHLKGEFPLRTREELPSVTPEPAGEIEIRFLPVGGIHTAIRDELIAKFSIKASGDTHHLLRGITLTNKGTAKNDDLRNMYLTRNRGRALSPVVKTMNGRKVTLRFSRPYFLSKGKRVLFQVRGSAYTSTRTISFTLEESSDLDAIPTRLSGRRYGNGARRLRTIPVAE